MDSVLQRFFEEQVEFRLRDGTEVDGGVFIGGTAFLPLEVLQQYPAAYRAEFDIWLNEVWRPEQQQRLAEILAVYANKKRYTDLVEAVKRQQVVPFVGSGMSVASGLPTWSNLLRKIREYTTCDSCALERLLKSCQFEEAADLIAVTTNPRLLAERIEHDLRIDDPSAICGPVCLLPVVFSSLVITTNLDGVLETLYKRYNQPFDHILAGPNLARYRTLKSPQSLFLLKLHGDCNRGSDRVLLSKEYDATYCLNSVVREELTLLYRLNHILFVGCSLGADRTVRLIEEVAAADPNMPKHFCFLMAPPDNTTRIERENFLTQRGIYPIWYGPPHDESLISACATGAPRCCDGGENPRSSRDHCLS
jgi:hypothetical protein